MKHTLAAVAVALCASHVAASTSSALVSSLTVYENGAVAVILTQSAEPPIASCAVNGDRTRYADSVATAGGRMQLSTLLQSLLSNRTLNVAGTGTCLTPPGGPTAETISYTRINPT